MNPGKAEPVSHHGETNSWYTPRWILDACGEFDLDPCGDSRWPTAKTIYDANGLGQDWFGRVWLNPPYGRDVSKWLERLAEHGNGMALIFVRTDTKWFQEFAPYCHWILLLSGRVRFINSVTLEIADKNPGAPSMICAVGDQPRPTLPGIFLKLEGDVKNGNQANSDDLFNDSN